MKGLKNKVVVVSGGSSGIGEATCKIFAEYGAKVVVVDIRDGVGQQTTDKLNKLYPNQAFYVHADISNENEVISMVQKTIAQYNRLDILINCAATFIMRGIDATVEEWQKIMAVNVMGYALCTKYAVPEMKKNGGGAIVNVCSISGFIAQPGYLTYNTTKGAVANMTRCMAMDLADDNIRVNAVCPGTVWTQSNEDYLGRTMGLDRAGADKHPEIGAAHMIKRCADPSEIAEAIAFLSSDHASFITAENLMVDGGYTAK